MGKVLNAEFHNDYNLCEYFYFELKYRLIVIRLMSGNLTNLGFSAQTRNLYVGNIYYEGETGSIGIELPTYFTDNTSQKLILQLNGNIDTLGALTLYSGTDLGSVFTRTSRYSIQLNGTNSFEIFDNVNNTWRIRIDSITGATTFNPPQPTSPWITQYLIDPPPAVVYGTPTSDTAYLYIPWTFPTQINVGFMQQLLPLIISQTLQLFVPSLSWNPQPVLTANTANLNITGLVLTALPPYGTTFTSITFPSEAIPRNVVLYSNASLFNLPFNVNNTLNTFYSNYQTYNNNSFVVLPAFQLSGPPSAPRLLVFSVVGSTSMTISYTIPLYTDGLNLTNTPASIIGYKAEYSTSGSTIRYPSPVAQALQTDIYGAVLTRALASTLFPDSTYSVSVFALNNVNVNYSPALTGTQITSSLAQPPSLGALSFPNRFTATAYLASDTNATTPITNLTTTNTAWVSSSAQFNINTTATRGNLGGAGVLTTLTTRTVRNAITNTGPTRGFLGYPIITQATLTTNNITITPSIATDAYALTEQQGFFLNGNTTFTIGTALFVASQHQTVFTATQTPPAVSQTLSYYYDNVSGVPTVSSLTWDFGGASTLATQISGVYVFSGTPIFRSTSSLGNMGVYFYRNNLITYNISIGGVATQQIRTNVSGITGITAGVMGTLGVADNITSSSLNTTFSVATSNASLTNIIAANVVNTTTNTSATPFTMVVDGPSYNLIFNVLAQTLPNTSLGNYVIGFRCYSGAVAFLGLFPAYLFGVLRYSTQAYNNALLLTATPSAGVQDQRQELQCANGVLCNSTNTNGWKNYTTYKYFVSTFNTANYSAVSAITRYSTFAWQVANNVNLYTTLSFNVYGLVGTITVVGGIAYINGSALQFYYRVEDSNSPVPDGTQTYLSSVWIDAQSVNGNSSFVSAANYSSPSGATITTYRGGLDTGAIYSGGVLTLPVLFPARQFSVSTTNVVIYARVGIPTGSGGLSYVSANIS